MSRWIALAFVFTAPLIGAERTLLDRMQDAQLHPTQKNDACFALRGDRTPATLSAMRKALSDQYLRACASKNLRAAGAIDLLRDAMRDADPDVRAVAVLEVGAFAKPEDLQALGEAAKDANLLVAANSVYALAG